MSLVDLTGGELPSVGVRVPRRTRQVSPRGGAPVVDRVHVYVRLTLVIYVWMLLTLVHM